MRKLLLPSIFALGAVALVGQPAVAQDEAPTGMPPEMEAYMKAMTPGEPHEEMAAEVGKFKMEFISWMDPAGDPTTGEGMAVRAMTNGGRILEERVNASMMGMPFEGVGHTGYDNVTGQYWSTWVDSMSTGVFVSKGAKGDDGSITYKGEMSDPVSGKMQPMKIVIRPETDGVQKAEFYTPNAEGKEYKSMVITYTRQGS